MGIEPTLSAWEAEVLPLNYTRHFVPSSPRTLHVIPSAARDLLNVARIK